MHDLSWMKEIRKPDPLLPESHPVHGPRTMTVRGTTLAVATDGHVLIAVHAPEDAFPALTHEAAEAGIRRMLTWRTAGEEVSLAALKAWLGPAERERLEACTHCGGPDRFATHDCPGCRAEAETYTGIAAGEVPGCHECEGGYVEFVPDPRPAWIGELLFNRNLLAIALEHLDAPTVRLAAFVDHEAWRKGGVPCVVVDGPGWRVVLAGMLPETAKYLEAEGIPVVTWPGAGPKCKDCGRVIDAVAIAALGERCLDCQERARAAEGDLFGRQDVRPKAPPSAIAAGR
jgi:hypothetical protein